MFGQRQYVFRAFSQCRTMNFHTGKSVIQVFTGL